MLYRVTHSEVAARPYTTWELVTVRRPFLASDLTFKQNPDLDALAVPQNGTITDVDHLYSQTGAELRRVAGRQPGIGGADQALLDVADEAAARKLARIKGSETVAGRKCRVLQFVEPPVGALSALQDKANHDDICVTSGGVILRELWTLKGRVVVTRQAVEIRYDAPDAAFDVSTAEDAGAGLAVPRVAPMDEGLTPPPTPRGYAVATAVDFFLPRADAPSQLAYASKVWAFTKGADLITVELGAGQVIPWDRADDKPLRLGTLGVSSLVRSDGIEIHWANSDHWIRVRGPMSQARLLPYARQVSSWDSSAAAAVPK